MKQQKISNWLKGIAIALALLGLFIIIVITIHRLRPFILFSWYAALVICYLILSYFWKVCTEIGRGNSFSNENATHFHKMALCGIVLAIGFLAKFFVLLILYKVPLIHIQTFLCICEVFAGIIFAVLCEALSKLILHAYEMKQENELTI